METNIYKRESGKERKRVLREKGRARSKVGNGMNKYNIERKTEWDIVRLKR